MVAEFKKHIKKKKPKFGQRREGGELQLIKKCSASYAEFDFATASKFSDYPLSPKTLQGLAKGSFFVPTEIQRSAIGLGLNGEDVLGAAQTGSGKTLAFVVTLLECLWRAQWTAEDGLGVLIISPTRELALQTFKVLRVVGSSHDFSAALIIGGTDYEFEKKRLERTNIVIATPGRLLQHMDENPLFTADNLKILVLDEADRMLDMGFERQLSAIVENLPKERQTLLFSATQTKSVKALGRLSLQKPVYVSVHENAKHATPAGLTQSLVVVEEWEKLSLLWSFLRNHLHKKNLVFFASCKEVRFYEAALRALGVGTALGALHGGLAHSKRTDVFETFSRKASMTLLATDVAARGLDFPGVDWVLQLDAPADVHEYIHRSGRTARYNRKGEALLALTPAQKEPFEAKLKAAKIPISEIRVNLRKMESVSGKLESLCAANPQLHDFAKKAFTSYVRSVHFMRDKAVFNVADIDVDKLARSFGLAAAPRLRFLKGAATGKKEKKKENTEAVEGEDLSALFHFDDAGNDRIMSVKRRNVFEGEEAEEEEPLPSSSQVNALKASRKAEKARAKLTKQILRNGVQLGKRRTFGDDDEATAADDDDRRFSLAEAAARMADEDRKDAQAYRERLKANKRATKQKLKKRTKVAEKVDEDAGAEAEEGDLASDDDVREAGEGFTIEEPDFEPLPKRKKTRKADEPRLDETLALRLLGAD